MLRRIVVILFLWAAVCIPDHHIRNIKLAFLNGFVAAHKGQEIDENDLEKKAMAAWVVYFRQIIEMNKPPQK